MHVDDDEQHGGHFDADGRLSPLFWACGVAAPNTPWVSDCGGDSCVNTVLSVRAYVAHLSTRIRRGCVLLHYLAPQVQLVSNILWHTVTARSTDSLKSMASVDDLRFFLALARHRNLVQAAAHLGVSRTTVARRVASMERKLGYRLFDKSPHGWVLTGRGQSLVAKAQAIDQAAEELFGGEVSGAVRLTGTVRIVTTDAFGQYVLTKWLAQLRDEEPGIRAEVVTSMRVSPYNGGDFDVAITVHRPDLVKVPSRPLLDYSLGLYAAPEYLARQGRPSSVSDLDNHEFVWFVESLNDIPVLQFLRPLVPDATIVSSFSNVSSQLAATAAGIGIGFLPRFATAQRPELERLLPEEVSLTRSFYLVAREASLMQDHIAATAAFLLRKADEDRHGF